MFTPISARLSIFAGLVLSAGAAFGQGVEVRTTGFYDRYPYPPAAGGTFAYSPYGRPTVTLAGPGGRVYDMPLQPKVLYYDTPFLTNQGWYRPTTITVMPNSRPPAAAVRTVPTAPAESPPAAKPPRIPAGAGTFKYDSGTRLRSPDTGPPPPAPMPPPTVDVAPVPNRLPTPALPTPRPKATDVPAVPDVPKLPDVPKVPGAPDAPKAAGSTVPNLGPAPKDM